MKFLTVILIFLCISAVSNAEEKVIKLEFNGKQWTQADKVIAAEDRAKFNADVIEIHAPRGMKMGQLTFISDYFSFDLQVRLRFVVNDKKELKTDLLALNPKSHKSILKSLQIIRGGADFDPSSINVFMLHHDNLATGHNETELKAGTDPTYFIKKNKDFHLSQHNSTAYLFGITPSTTFEQFILASQTIKRCNIDQVLPLVDKVFNAVSAIKMDPDVKPAVHFNGLKENKNQVRIEIEIIGAGIYKTATGKLLNDVQALTTYIAAEKIIIIAKNKTPAICLKGAKEILFKEAQEAIKAASNAGVSQIIFSVPKKNK